MVVAGGRPYALPAPPGRWVASGFLCKLYRYPCPVGDDGCDPDTQPPLESQPCDYDDPLLTGRTISSLLAGEVLDDDYPYACAPGTYGEEGDVAGQTGPMCSGECPAGYMCAAGTVTPLPCTQEGTYCPVGSGQSTPCPAGQTGYSYGMTSEDECVPCPAGHWCPSARIVCGRNVQRTPAEDQSA